jgi:2-polyprenyl-3-methyl-5-hydroxy-6-metoxy-1,4-benzoquinol methylase
VPGHWIGNDVFGDLQGRLGLVKCRGCTLIFINPRPSSARLSAYYSGGNYTYHEGSTIGGAKADFIFERIERSLPPGAPRTLLDYGAGGGHFLSNAAARGWAVKGFEPAAQGLERCREAGLDVTGRLEELPDARFGLITLHHVFEHVEDPEEVLKRIRRLVAPDGRLFIEVPNAGSLRARLALPFLSKRFDVDEAYRAYPIHLIYYSARTLRAMLQRAGWTVDTTFTVGLGMDEYLVRHEPPPTAPAPDANAATARSSAPALQPGRRRRKVRHALRDAFLDLELGENLAVIAHPDRG